MDPSLDRKELRSVNWCRNTTSASYSHQVSQQIILFHYQTIATVIVFSLHKCLIYNKDIYILITRETLSYLSNNDIYWCVLADKKSDIIRIIGHSDKVTSAVKALENKIEEIQGVKKEHERKNFKLELTVDTKYHGMIIGRGGSVISKIKAAHKVNIQIPKNGGAVITIIGCEEATRAAEADIMAIITDHQAQVTEEVEIDHSVHARLIGTAGKSIRKIKSQFKVVINFPNKDSANPDMITISGHVDKVNKCKEHLLKLQEKYVSNSYSLIQS